MKFTTVTFKGERAYLLPIGDIHWGDKAFKGRGKAKLKGNLDWVAERPNEAAVFLMGDIFNIAGRDTKTSQYDNDPEEVLEAEEFFKPYAPFIIGAIRGNHERRIVNNYGYDPLKVFAKHLEIPYFGISAVVKIQVGARPEPNPNWFWQTYYAYFHHSTGGGGSLGNAVNRAGKLEGIVEGCDVYCVGHNHQLGTAVKSVFLPTPAGLRERKVHYVSTGSYLDYAESYAEEGMYAPGKLGSPRLRFSGQRDHHDVHVSI